MEWVLKAPLREGNIRYVWDACDWLLRWIRSVKGANDHSTAFLSVTLWYILLYVSPNKDAQQHPWNKCLPTDERMEEVLEHLAVTNKARIAEGRYFRRLEKFQLEMGCKDSDGESIHCFPYVKDTRRFPYVTMPLQELSSRQYTHTERRFPEAVA